MMKYIYCLLAVVLFGTQTKAQSLYFPPLSAAAQWDTLSPASLGWCPEPIDTLYDFLQQANTKAFIVLKDGKIVIEKYFGTFTADSAWYWASAGKTITSFLVGKAQEESLLSLNDKSSMYQGSGWTDLPPSQEDSILILHQLTMTSGLDDGVPDNHCTIDTCLKYLAPVGTRWAYHNAPYTLLETVLENATAQPINTYTQLKLKNQTGMTGAWYMSDFDNVFFSKPRSMARFGLLIQNHGIWNGDTLLHDNNYFNQMVNTSQNLNLSYGYLWWLNGKSSFMLPGLQTVFPGSYAPQAPADMIAALGKNGQILSISPSKGILFIRMGDAPGSSIVDVPAAFCNEIWIKLNAVMCSPTNVTESQLDPLPTVYPVPILDQFNVRWPGKIFNAEVYDLSGRLRFQANQVDQILNGATVHWANGIYVLKLTSLSNEVKYMKIQIQH